MSQMSSKSSQVNRIHPLEAFREEVAQVMNSKGGLTDSDLHVLLQYLARDKKEIVYDLEASPLRISIS